MPKSQSITTPWDSSEKPTTPWAAYGEKPQGALLEPQYADPYRAYVAAPGPETSGPLLTALRPVVDEALKSYAGSEAQSPTLRARAKQMALEAVRRYDPARAKLRTHLLSHLRGLRRVAERTTSAVYVPEQWRLDARRVDSALSELRDELAREPSEAELSARTGLPPARIRKAVQVPGVLASSQAGDAVPVSHPSQRAWETWVRAVHADLNPTDQVILEHSLGELFGRPTLPANQIAKKLNVSPGLVSQKKARIQQQLDEFDNFMGRGG